MFLIYSLIAGHIISGIITCVCYFYECLRFARKLKWENYPFSGDDILIFLVTFMGGYISLFFVIGISLSGLGEKTLFKVKTGIKE